jgi:hypothetical protein
LENKIIIPKVALMVPQVIMEQRTINKVPKPILRNPTLIQDQVIPVMLKVDNVAISATQAISITARTTEGVTTIAVMSKLILIK